MPSKRDVERLADEVHDLFEEVWRIPRFGGHRRGFRPQVDCFHTDDPHELTVVVELAGVEPDTVRIDATERHLRVWGERVRPRVEGQVFQQMEIEYGLFERQISLSEPVDPARARATYGRGLLTIVLPVAERSAQPVKVEIEVRTSP
jgi:HSP20 family protein